MRFNAAGRLWLALLFLGLCSSAFAQETPGEWARRLRQAQTASREEQVETLREFARSEIARSEQSFREELANMLASQDSEEIRDGIEALASVLEVYERAETPIETNANDAASRILSEPQFRKVDEAPSNWLKRALESLERIEPEEREPQSNRFELTRINLEPLFYGIIVALAVGAGVALFFFARGWRSTRATGAAKKKRKVGLLEEGEEALRTDEWLARADELGGRTMPLPCSADAPGRRRTCVLRPLPNQLGAPAPHRGVQRTERRAIPQPNPRVRPHLVRRATHERGALCNIPPGVSAINGGPHWWSRHSFPPGEG